MKRELTQLAKRLLVSLEPPFEVAGERVDLSASIGIACCPDAGETSARLLKSADLAMYAAKSDGKNAFQAFQPKHGAKLVERVTRQVCANRSHVQKLEVVARDKLARGPLRAAAR